MHNISCLKLFVLFVVSGVFLLPALLVADDSSQALFRTFYSYYSWLTIDKSQVIKDIDYSPSGTYLLVITQDSLQVLSPPEGAPVYSFPVTEDTKWAFSRDEKYLVWINNRSSLQSSGSDKVLSSVLKNSLRKESSAVEVCILDFSKGKVARFYDRQISAVSDLEFSDDSKSLYGCGGSYAFFKWDLQSKALTKTIQARGYLDGGIISPNLKTVMYWFKDKGRMRSEVHQLNIDDNELNVDDDMDVTCFKSEFGDTITASAFTSDGKMVVFGTKSSGMPLWNTERRRKELHFDLPYTTSRQFPSFLKFAPDDSQLIAGMNNGPYAFIDVETGTLLNLLVVDSDYRTCTYIKYPTNPSDDPNNSKADHSQDIYLLKSNNSVGKFAIDSYKWEPGGSGHFGSIIGCALSNDEKYFFTVGSKGRIYKWSAFDSFNKELVYHSQGADIISAAFNDDRTYVAAGIESFQVKIVSLSPVRIKKKSELPEDDINYGEDALGYWYTTSEAFSTVNRKIVDKAATETNDRFYRDDQSVEIVDTGNYSPQQIAFSAYSTEKPSSLIVSGGSDNNVVEETFYIPLEKMFPLIRYKKNNNVERMKQNHLKKDILRISSPFFIDDGRKFIGIFKNAVYELGLTTLGAKRKLLVPGAGFLKRAVAISRLPLIVVSDSKGIFLIDYSKFEVLGNISYSKSIESMALSADGSFLAVASQTGKPGRAIKTLEVLAVPSLKMLAQINRGDSMVTCMTCSENGRTIYTGDNKGAVEVFQFYKELAD